MKDAKEKVYMGLDVETTGQSLSHNAMIALGAVVMDTNSTTLHTFKVCLGVPSDKGWEPRCLAEFWSQHADLKASIERDAIDAKRAMVGFACWLNLMDLLYGDRLVLLTDNPAFDVAWINLYLSQYTLRPSLYYGFSLQKILAGEHSLENAAEMAAQIRHCNVGYPEDYAMEFALSPELDPAAYYEDGERTIQSEVVKANREEKAFLSSAFHDHYGYRRIWDTDSAFHGAIYTTLGRAVEWGLEGTLGVQNAMYANDHDVLHDAANVAANYILFLKKFEHSILVVPSVSKKAKMTEEETA